MNIVFIREKLIQQNLDELVLNYFCIFYYSELQLFSVSKIET